MNLNEVSTIVDDWAANELDKYIKKVARAYSLSESALKDLYANSCTAADDDRANLMKLKIKELKEKCKQLNHPVSGKKSVLVDRILSGKREDRKSKKKEPVSIPAAAEIQITKNESGNYTYDGLVIDKGTRMVVGKEGEDGSVLPMTKICIEKCHRYKLKFSIPMNLDAIEETKKPDDSEDDDDDDDLLAEDDEEDEDAESVCPEEEEEGGEEDDEEDDEEFIYVEEA